MTLSAILVTTTKSDWVPLRDGIAMRPLRFEHDGYSLLLRVEPGAVVTRHRHTGSVHAINLAGRRKILDTGEVIGPGDFVFEPAGNEDCWACEGSEPCIVHIVVRGRVEYLDSLGRVVFHTDRDTALAAYLEHCAAIGRSPEPEVTGTS